MSLTTPESIGRLQRKLYCKAKAEPAFRFYLLYDKICREDMLVHAWRLCRANGGAPGVDGVSFEAIEEGGLEKWLAGLRTELVGKTYRPAPVRRVLIPKPGGGERALGIPTIRDRVVQTAAKLVLEPIFEADFEDSAYGYRPGRGGLDAIKEVHRCVLQGYTDVVDADLSKYFDTIPHRELMGSVARRIVDRHVLRLIKLWLRAPVEERDGDGGRGVGGGRQNTRGTPQGGVISPLLANLYMNRFLKYWRQRDCGRTFLAQLVSYADDFVILSRGHAAQAKEWAKSTLARLGLTLNEEKTALRDARRERFTFLGYAFGPHRLRRDGSWYLGASPSSRSVQRCKAAVSGLLVAGNMAPWEEIRDKLNRLIRGWTAYFSYGSCALAYRELEHYVWHCVHRFLRRRHKADRGGNPDLDVFGRRGVLRPKMLRVSPWARR